MSADDLAAQRLHAVMTSSPHATSIDLSKLRVSDLTPLLPALAQFAELRSLSLAHNALGSLPRDLSVLRALSTLDLRHNRFAQVDDLLPSLLSLPSLSSLQISASEEEEERIVVALPDLLELNGTPLTNPGDEDDGTLGASPGAAMGTGQGAGTGALALADLSGLANGASGLASGIGVVGSGIGAGTSSGGDSGMNLGVKPSANAEVPNTGRPTAEALVRVAPPPSAASAAPASPAGVSVSVSGSGSVGVRSNVQAHVQARRGAEVTMSGSDLDAVAQLFRSIIGVASGVAPGTEQQLQQRFDRHVQSTLNGLDQQLQSISDPFLKQGEVLRAKHQLYEVCFAETIAMLAPTAPAFGEVLRALRRAHLTLFEEVPAVLRAAVPAHEQQLEMLRREVGRAEGETRQLLAAAELLEKEAVTHADDQLKLRAEHELVLRENERLRKSEGNAQTELKRLRASATSATPLVGGGRGSYAKGARGSNGDSTNSTAAPAFQRALGLGSGSGSGAGPDSAKENTQDQHMHAQSPPHRRQPAQQQQSQQQQPVRAISLKQLKDHIEQIYASKIKFDQKCKQARLPRETMEQHMYTYLNQRYGLKPLIVDHASAIIKAVNKCAKQDNDVAVFGKILRNEIDEEFRFVQAQLKQTVDELLRVYLKGKYPLKADREISRMLQQRQRGEVLEEEWSDIIKYMYNHKDALSLIVMVKDLCRQRARAQDHEVDIGRRGSARRSRGTATKEEQARGRASMNIPHRLLLKVLLDFQLHGHDRFLSAFRELFQQADTDRDGVIDEPQFRSLVSFVDSSKTVREVDEMLDRVDPFSNQRITFSECVAGMAQELLQLGNGSSANEMAAAPPLPPGPPPPGPPPQSPPMKRQ